MNSTLKTVGMELIQSNPYRMLHTYPYIEPKLESLVRSIEDVGFWEGVIARPNPDGEGYQIAFGHHRIEAAKRAGLNKAPIIVRDLTEEQMVQFMGRENGEDYKADFLTMLNTWEGAASFLEKGNNTDTDISRVLGWTRPKTVKGKVYDLPNFVAETCAMAYKVISRGLMDREDMVDLSVNSVRDLCAPLLREIKRRETLAKHHSKTMPAEDVERATEVLVEKAAKGTKSAARSVRSGRVARKDVQSTVRREIHEKQTDVVGPVPPDFLAFVQRTYNSVEKMLNGDATAEKIDEIIKVIPDLPEGEYLSKVEALNSELAYLVARTQRLQRKIETATASRGKNEPAQPEAPMLEVVS